MVLLSLGPQALIALLHADNRANAALPDTFWLSAVTELAALPHPTEEVPAFPSIFPSSN